MLAFLLMGRSNVLLAILSHEAAHRLLFANRRVNDVVGRWFLAYPVFLPIDLYRRGHMNHHRDEFGPNEPDIPLYRGYPIPRASMRRKLTRDALGITGVRIMRGLVRGLHAPSVAVCEEAWRIVVTQIVIFGLFAAIGRWYLYPLLWLLPHLTVWRVLNRLRSIAEHGGMTRSDDRRLTTHSVHQSWLARLVFVPYNTGWHLADHVDSGIPMRNLPACSTPSSCAPATCSPAWSTAAISCSGADCPRADAAPAGGSGRDHVLALRPPATSRRQRAPSHHRCPLRATKVPVTPVSLQRFVEDRAVSDAVHPGVLGSWGGGNNRG